MLELCTAIADPWSDDLTQVAAAMLSWFETAWEPFWEDKRLDGKLGAVFATGGGLAQGVEHVLSSLQRLLASFRIQCVTPSPTRSGFDSYGAVAVTGTPPFDEASIAAVFVSAGEALGRLVATQTLTAHKSRGSPGQPTRLDGRQRDAAAQLRG